MTGEQKIEAAKSAKERGTMFLQQGKLQLAFNKYKRVEDLLEFEKSMDPEKTKVNKSLSYVIMLFFFNRRRMPFFLPLT